MSVQPKNAVFALAGALLAALALFTVAPARAQTAQFPQADIRFLLEGVKVIESSGAPGPVAAFGPQAFPVVLGTAGKNISAPVVAASRLGSGRVVAFGHGGFLGSTDKGDSGKFLQNSIRWASSRTTAKPGEIKVGILRNDGLQKYLKAQGFDATVLDPKDWHTKFTGLHVVVADTGDWKPDASRPALDTFIRGGGGLVTAGLGWGWLQLNPDKTLSDHHPRRHFVARWHLGPHREERLQHHEHPAHRREHLACAQHPAHRHEHHHTHHPATRRSGLLDTHPDRASFAKERQASATATRLPQATQQRQSAQREIALENRGRH
jgi:hypothetical protein